MELLPKHARPRKLAAVWLLVASSAACSSHTSHRTEAALGRTKPGSDGQTASDDDTNAQDPDYLFDPETVRTFELRLHEEDLAFLDADPKAEQYVPGELYFEGQRVKPVGIRYKGSNGSFVGCLSNGGFPATGSKSCPKLSMKIKIDYGDPEAKFYGQKKLLFHAMNGDRSLMRERLGYGLFSELGVHASRTTHVRLLINGVFSGLYLLVEEIDGRFTRSRFADGGHGNLYKEAWPSSDEESFYRNALETNRDEEPSVDKMLAFSQALRRADDETLPSVLSDWMNLDYAARYVAVDRTIRHDDGPYHWYCQASDRTDNADWHRLHLIGSNYCGNHNFYWYEDTKADRLWPVPWDLDNTFPAFAGFVYVRGAWDDLSYDCSAPSAGLFGSQMPPTCDPLQRAWALALNERIRAAQRQLIDGPLSERAVGEKLAHWSELIAPVVAEAAELYASEPGLSTWLGELATLQGAIARLREQAFPTPPETDEEPSEQGQSARQ